MAIYDIVKKAQFALAGDISFLSVVKEIKDKAKKDISDYYCALEASLKLQDLIKEYQLHHFLSRTVDNHDVILYLTKYINEKEENHPAIVGKSVFYTFWQILEDIDTILDIDMVYTKFSTWGHYIDFRFKYAGLNVEFSVNASNSQTCTIEEVDEIRTVKKIICKE